MKETQLYFNFYYGFIIDDVIKNLAPIYQAYRERGGYDLSNIFDGSYFNEEIDDKYIIPMDYIYNK